MCIFGIIHCPRFRQNPWTNGIVEGQNEHPGRIICIISQQNDSHWSNQSGFWTFAQNTQKLSIAILSFSEMVNKEN